MPFSGDTHKLTQAHKITLTIKGTMFFSLTNRIEAKKTNYKICKETTLTFIKHHNT